MNYREQRNYENLEKRIYLGEGEYNIPKIAPVQYTEPCEFIPFNFAIGCKEKSSVGCHFFIDDYQFLRIWDNIDRYIQILKPFKYVFSPDFSTYTDFPKIIQLYNHYRKHWIGAYLQENGVNIIPTISWSTPGSFDWCFDGEPKKSAVAVSSVGCIKNKKARELFMIGFKEMVDRLMPKVILFYGKIPSECHWHIIDCGIDCEIIRLETHGERMNKRRS